VVIESPFEPRGNVTEILEHVSGRTRVQHGGDENAFAHAPLRESNGLSITDEYLSRTASGEAHDAKRRISLK
jgi:hypothetical protein